MLIFRKKQKSFEKTKLLKCLVIFTFNQDFLYHMHIVQNSKAGLIQ